MNVIPFPRRSAMNNPYDPSPREIFSFSDFFDQGGDVALDRRATELLPAALEMLELFPAAPVAEIIAYAAARLERTGFKIFNP